MLLLVIFDLRMYVTSLYWLLWRLLIVINQYCSWTCTLYIKMLLSNCVSNLTNKEQFGDKAKMSNIYIYSCVHEINVGVWQRKSIGTLAYCHYSVFQDDMKWQITPNIVCCPCCSFPTWECGECVTVRGVRRGKCDHVDPPVVGPAHWPGKYGVYKPLHYQIWQGCTTDATNTPDLHRTCPSNCPYRKCKALWPVVYYIGSVFT